MIPVIGLIVLIPMSVRLALWGRRRALPRAWLAWTPLTAPLVWIGGAVWTSLSVRDQLSAIQARPPSERATALSNQIAEALQLTLVGGAAALVVLVGCFAFFSLRPRLESH